MHTSNYLIIFLANNLIRNVPSKNYNKYAHVYIKEIVI